MNNNFLSIDDRLKIVINKYETLKYVWELKRATCRDEWDVCFDGAQYSINNNLDTSDRTMLLLLIEEKNLQFSSIPLSNCCDTIVKAGLQVWCVRIVILFTC